MARRPNVLWLMSDQHNANCTGFAAHPNVVTPNMDRIADEGELYDHRNDPGEIDNVWADPSYADTRFDLLAQLMRFTLQYRTDTGRSSYEKGLNKRFAPTNLVHKGRRYWSDLKEAYTKKTVWPPKDEKSIRR